MPRSKDYEPRYRPGTRVRISYEAEVAPQDQRLPDHVLALQRQAEQVWHEDSREVSIEVIPPDVVPGCEVRANGILWVVRKSNKRTSYRVMPVNLSGRNRTLAIEEFYRRFPKAKLEYDPRWPQMLYLPDDGVETAMILADPETMEAIQKAMGLADPPAIAADDDASVSSGQEELPFEDALANLPDTLREQRDGS